MRSKRYIILILLLAGVVLLNLPFPAARRVKAAARDNLVPFQSMMASAGATLREAAAFLRNPGKPGEEKRKLLEEVAALKDRVRMADIISRENDELRRLLEFSKRSERKLILCEVVYRNETEGWWQTLVVNKGSEDGVQTGMAVTTVDGLVGKTVEVSRHTCTVLLITDQTCRVACRFSRTGVFGIVRGGGVSPGGKVNLEMLTPLVPSRMDYVDIRTGILANDEVVTSGLGGIFPEGLRLGYVASSSVDVSGLYRRADIAPSANLNGLRFVFVVAERPGAREVPPP